MGTRFSVPVHTGPGAHPASYTMDTGSFPGVRGRGVALTIHPHLAPRSKSRAVPQLPLFDFVACYRMNFTLLFNLVTVTTELSGPL
jgi:hypothetical protein